MLNQTTKTRILFFVALMTGIIGTIGQSYLLHHELVNCYPYKMMDWNFYKSIAKFGIYFAPIVAIISGILFGLKRFWLAIMAPVVICPLLFSVVFKVSALLRFSENENWLFDGKTSTMAAQDFYLYTFNLLFIGMIIGGVCSFILYRFSIKKNLP